MFKSADFSHIGWRSHLELKVQGDMAVDSPTVLFVSKFQLYYLTGSSFCSCIIFLLYFRWPNRALHCQLPEYLQHYVWMLRFYTIVPSTPLHDFISNLCHVIGVTVDEKYGQILLIRNPRSWTYIFGPKNNRWWILAHFDVHVVF